MFFVLYGASGAGKTTLLHMINKLKGNYTIHQKDTTRPSRKNENSKEILELRFLKKLNPLDYYLVYRQYGYEYGIRKDLLDKAIKNNEFHFVIINDVKTIEKFKKIFPKTVTIYIHCDPDKIDENIFRRDGLFPERRRRRIKHQYLDFVKNNLLFDHIIVNFWDIKHAKEQIKNILNLYKQR